MLSNHKGYYPSSNCQSNQNHYCVGLGLGQADEELANFHAAPLSGKQHPSRGYPLQANGTELSGQKIEYPDRIFRGRCVSSVSLYYIQNCFSTQTLRDDLEAKAKSSAGHQRISLSDLREFCIPLPPLAEQRRIVG